MNKKEKYEREEQIIKACTLFEEWKQRLTMGTIMAEDLPKKLNEFLAEIETKITDPVLLKVLRELIEMKLGDLHLARGIGHHTLKIHAICPNTASLNNIMMVCNWEGDAFVSKKEWKYNRAWFECPKCGKKIKQKAMRLVITKEQG